MAQSGALREQPSMDEILASIRRIIDVGEGKKGNPNTVPERRGNETAPRAERLEPRKVEPTAPPPPANDARGKVSPMPQAPFRQEPRIRGEAQVKPVADEPQHAEMFERDVLSAVDDYLQQENAGNARQRGGPERGYRSQSTAEQQIPELEAALEAEFGAVDRDLMREGQQRQDDARFTPEDNSAFQEVGSVLRGTVEGFGAHPPAHREQPHVRSEPSRMSAEAAPQPRMDALVSDAVAQSVSHSFGDLTSQLGSKSSRSLEEIAEGMLRPMLQEWLDNNLPTIVERLVRAEIERIARGE